MAKGRSSKAIEEQVARVQALRVDPSTPAARVELAAALESARAVLVVPAANLIGEAELDGFDPLLRAAFDGFMEQPLKRDPGCAAKTAVARALYRCGEPAHAVYLRGIQYVQREPVWGGTQDTAVELRGTCALALVRAGYPDVMLELADLLADPEPLARLAAAQAIAYSERTEAALPLLRMKARLGDDDARVTAACVSGLLALAPERSLPFIAGLIDGEHEGSREAALLALGESRLPAALPLLRAVVERSVESELRAVALTAIAALRNDPGYDYLLALVSAADESPARAEEAIDALAIYKRDPNLRARALAAAERSGSASLRAYAARALAASE